jgi:hypothetical protein
MHDNEGPGMFRADQRSRPPETYPVWLRERHRRGAQTPSSTKLITSLRVTRKGLPGPGPLLVQEHCGHHPGWTIRGPTNSL